MPGKHAKLSPSASERWIQCPASVRMAATVPKEEDSVYAQEGTLAHDLGEIKASFRFGKITKRQHTIRRNKWLKRAEAFGLGEDGLADMDRYTDGYVDYLEERLNAYPNSSIMLEQRLDTGLPSCWGTSDAVIYSPVHVEIIDLKYGAGVAVSAKGNSQLRLYGLGALDTYGDILGDTETITCTVYQPRIGDGHAHSETLDADDLRAWRKKIQPIAMEALGPDAHFGPSEDACRWCPVAGSCRAQMQATFGVVEDYEERDPDLLSHEELGGLLAVLPALRDWTQAVHDVAMKTMYDDGQHVPGWKVVYGNGRRQIANDEAAIQRLVEAGYDREDVTRTSLQTLGHLDRVTSKGLPDILGDLLSQSQGKPAIVPESDPRDPANANLAAAAAFAEETYEDIL